MAETARTKTTATVMLPPSYHPSSMPYCLIPKARDNAAQIRRMIMVESLNASIRKLKKLLVGAFCMQKGFKIMMMTIGGFDINGNVRTIGKDLSAEEGSFTYRFLQQRSHEVDCPKDGL